MEIPKIEDTKPMSKMGMKVVEYITTAEGLEQQFRIAAIRQFIYNSQIHNKDYFYKILDTYTEE
jgi:hypothetical protein